MPRTFQNGWFRFADDIEIDGRGISPFVIGRAWMIEFVELTSGVMSFVSDRLEVIPEQPRFGIYYAPFSIITLFIDHPRGTVEGFGSVDFDPGLPDSPMMFDPSRLKIDNINSLHDVVRAGTPIWSNSKPSILALRTKRIIDGCYNGDLSIARVAKEVGVSREHLSRQFRKDYALSPLEYLHKLRMAEANLRLSEGRDIIDVSADVGYNDLGRFYKQFRKAFLSTPGNCKVNTSKSAKTT